jgi:hypothetical protein
LKTYIKIAWQEHTRDFKKKIIIQLDSEESTNFALFFIFLLGGKGSHKSSKPYSTIFPPR